MKRVLAVLIAGLFSAGVFAQTPGSAVPKDTPGATPMTKSQSRAEAKVHAREAAKPGIAPKATPTPGGDAATAAGSTMPVETKAQKAAETKKAKRKVKKAPEQGKTPT